MIYWFEIWVAVLGLFFLLVCGVAEKVLLLEFWFSSNFLMAFFGFLLWAVEFFYVRFACWHIFKHVNEHRKERRKERKERKIKIPKEENIYNLYIYSIRNRHRHDGPKSTRDRQIQGFTVEQRQRFRHLSSAQRSNPQILHPEPA